MSEMTQLTNDELLKLHFATCNEAKRRGLTIEVGQLGEKLAIELFKSRPDLPLLTASQRGTKNVDALSRDGERYSIKTVHRGRKTGTVYPDPENNEQQLFEFLVVVVLNKDFELERVVLLSWDQFCQVRSWDRRMNAWYVGKSRRALNVGHQVFPARSPSA